MPVRQLHGYWDSAEFSSASRIATGKMPAVFFVHQRYLAHRYHNGASSGNGAHAQQKALVSIRVAHLSQKSSGKQVVKGDFGLDIHTISFVCQPAGRDHGSVDCFS